jgi:hypothetical protein
MENDEYDDEDALGECPELPSDKDDEPDSEGYIQQTMFGSLFAWEQ